MTTDLDTAHKVCTPNELAAYELWYRGMSQRNISLALNLSRTYVKDLVANANRKILNEQKGTPA